MANLKNGEESVNKNITIPKWIQEDFFLPILEKDYPEFKNVTKFGVKPATGPGENYSSIMLRVCIDIELKSSDELKTSYILKTTLENSESNSVLNSMNVFPKESEMYGGILPKFEKLYAEVGEAVQIGPQCKFVEIIPERTTIVMEDLKARKFKNVDRCLGLDLRHMENVLKKLAELHAASAVHHEHYGPYSAHFAKSFYNEDNRSFYIKRGKLKTQKYLECLKKWGDCEKYVDLWPSADKVISWFIDHDEVNPDEFTVLNHGDCWSNNIMFQYNENGDIEETLFVDFQLSKFGSPAQDLYYLITSSAAYDIRVAEFDNLIRIYHEHLAEKLKILKYSKTVPTLKDIHVLMIKYSLWSFFTAVNVLGIVLLDPSDNANIDNLMDDDEFRRSMLMNPRYVRAMKQLLPWWENRGVFQV